MYDWANSAFTTLVVTFVYGTYFTQAIATDEITGTAQWSQAVGISGFLIAVVSPILGIFADRGGKRRRYLLICTTVCIASTALLTMVAPGQAHAVIVALMLFVVANVAFETAMVFYNSYLPSLADENHIGRVSGYGWGLGYVGGLCCLALALLVLVREEPLLGVSTADGFNYRATNLLVAGWFLIFSLPMFLVVRDDSGPARRVALQEALGELVATLRHMRRYRQAAVFLLARLVYNDGLVTVFAFGGIYAAGTFGMTLSEVVQFGIALNVAAGIGAFVFGFVDDRLGGKTTILITLAALLACTVLAVLAPSKTWLWAAGIGIGIFAGPNQSASRSLMAKFTPDAHCSEFFGLFAFSGKITAFAGPILLGLATAWAGDQRVGVATVMVFFVVGALLLLAVDEKQGIAASRS